jgi:ferritin-like metal-binding protein YciE
MNHAKKNLHLVNLTATEVSNLWSSYLMNSMHQRLFEYFFASTEDSDLKQVLEKTLNQSQKNLNELKVVFSKENLPVPLGFTDQDVRVGAPKVFSDSFILYFCFDLTNLAMSTYPIALSDSTRNDVRNHFQENIAFSVKIQNEIVDLMLLKGIYLRPPQVAIDGEVEFADSFMYLNGFLGGSRPLNTAEIANVARIIHRAQFSKMIFVTFSKLAQTKDLKQHFSKGRDGIEKVLDSLQEVFEKENIPFSASADYQITDVEMSPFSDKLMLFFVNTCLGIFCFTMVSQGKTSSLRTDIISKFGKIADDMEKYYGLGLLLAIKEKWLEQPPQAVDRKV